MKTTNKKYYLAGPMTGLPELNYPAFDEAAEVLRCYGVEIESPAEHDHPINFSYEDYLKAGIKKMMNCQGVVLLQGWQRSNGARLEMFLATQLKMEVMTYEELINQLETARVRNFPHASN